MSNGQMANELPPGINQGEPNLQVYHPLDRGFWIVNHWHKPDIIYLWERFKLLMFDFNGKKKHNVKIINSVHNN